MGEIKSQGTCLRFFEAQLGFSLLTPASPFGDHSMVPKLDVMVFPKYFSRLISSGDESSLGPG